MSFVLLPGLDGTGHYSAALAARLAAYGPVIVQAYPSRQRLGYDALAHSVEARLPAAPCILVAESFAGPLALKLVRRAPHRFGAVVLGASFASMCLPFAGALSTLAAYAPARALPTRLAARCLWGQWATPDRARELERVLAGVDARVLAHRAAQALSVDERTGRAIHTPALVLHASADRVLPRTARSSIERAVPHAQIVELDAPHFLFQAVPDAAATLIAESAARRAYSGS